MDREVNGAGNKESEVITNTLEAKAITFVKIQGVYVSIKSALSSLGRYCKPLTFFTGDENYEFAASGSSFLFKQNDRYFLLCSKHQFKRPCGNSFESDDLFLATNFDKELNEDEGVISIQAKRVNYAKINGYDNKQMEDVVLAEFEKVHNGYALERYFVDFDLMNTISFSKLPSDRIKLVFAIGYPDVLIDFKITDTHRFEGIMAMRMDLLLEPKKRSSDDLATHIPLKVHSECTNELPLGGFSGAPVFFIYQDDDDSFVLGFTGILTHGGEQKQVVHIYPLSAIKKIVGYALNDR